MGNIEALRGCVHRENIEFVDAALEAAMDASQLTDNLNSFGRNQSLRPQTANLSRLLSRFSSIVEPMLGPGITLKTKLLSEDCQVRIDSGHLEIALTNIIINSRESMPEGGSMDITTSITEVQGRRVDDSLPGVHSTVLQSELTPGKYAIIAIFDTGSGMSQDTLARVFEPFFTTKRRNEFEGLGLSFAYGFIKQSGGDILLESQIGGGTKVEVYLPVLQAHSLVGSQLAAAAPSSIHDWSSQRAT